MRPGSERVATNEFTVSAQGHKWPLTKYHSMSGSAFTTALLFLGPTELMIVGLIAVVIIFGSRAPDVAKRVGEAVGNFSQSRRKVESEVNEVKTKVTDEVHEVRDDVGLDEDINDIRSDIQEINEDLEKTTSTKSNSSSDRRKEEETNAN